MRHREQSRVSREPKSPFELQAEPNPEKNPLFIAASPGRPHPNNHENKKHENTKTEFGA